MDWVAILLGLLLVLTVVGSILVVRAIDGSSSQIEAKLRERLVLGIPWGTLVVVAIVLTVYLFVQDGITDFDNPVTIPYRAWSYFYPLGILTASFSHAGSNHLVGNLAGTLVIAPIAEYAWGHYPPDNPENDSDGSWTRAVRSNPWLRAVVIFPLAVLGIGLLTSIFAVGPVIGFSGVVFAFAGFAIVRYPIGTIVAAIAAQGAVLTVYRALMSPVATYSVSPRPPAPPSWAEIAIQGHALGFIIGFLLALFVFDRRGYRPRPLRLWIALILYGFSKSLWAIYWFGPDETYLLFRAPGVIVVVLLALVATLAFAASERPVVPKRLLDRMWRSGSTGVETVTRRQTAIVSIVLVLALISGPAIPVNGFVLDESSNPDSAVAVEDYTVYYAEDVENQLVPAIDAFGLSETTNVRVSGVIVSSTERNIWIRATSKDRLEFSGSETVYVGGPGWREAVHVERSGWTPVGNDTVYHVLIETEESEPQLAYSSDASRADTTIEARNVTIRTDDDQFSLEVENVEDGTTVTVPLPDDGETITAHELQIEHDDDSLYASTNETTVQIASRETYN